MRKGLVCKLLAAAMMVTTVAGYGGISTSASETGERPFEGVTINHLAYSGAYENVIMNYIDEFEELTGAKVNYQQLDVAALSQKNSVVAAAGGSEVDVYSLAPLGESKLYISNEWIECLDPYIEKSGFDIDDYFDSVLETCSDEEGKVYMIPTATEQQVVFYDKQVFEENGIEIPTTMEELEEVAAALTDRENGYYGLVMRGQGYAAVTQFSSFLRAFGGDFYKDGVATLSTPESTEAFKFYAKLLNEYGPEGPSGITGAESTAYFNQGKAAMRIDCSVQYASHIDKAESVVADRVGYFMVPSGSGGDAPFATAPYSFAISSGSKNKEAAWAFIEWACSKEMDLRGQMEGNLSARKSTWENEEANANLPKDLVEVAMKTMEIGHGTDRPYLVQGAEARTMVGNMLDSVIAGEEDFEEKLAETNEELQKILDKEP